MTDINPIKVGDRVNGLFYPSDELNGVVTDIIGTHAYVKIDGTEEIRSTPVSMLRLVE